MLFLRHSGLYTVTTSSLSLLCHCVIAVATVPLRRHCPFSATTSLPLLFCHYVTAFATLPLRHCCRYSSTTSLLSVLCHYVTVQATPLPRHCYRYSATHQCLISELRRGVFGICDLLELHATWTASWTARAVKMGPIGFPEASVTRNLRCVMSQKRAEITGLPTRISTFAEFSFILESNKMNKFLVLKDSDCLYTVFRPQHCASALAGLIEFRPARCFKCAISVTF